MLPLAWLGFFRALGGEGFWHVFAQKVGLSAGLGKAMVLGFANMFQVFGFTRMEFYANWMNELPTVLQVYAGVQTVVALPLLFFFALGLRTRFRMR